MSENNRYSNLESSIRGDANFLYNNIQTSITSQTLHKRNQLKSSLDDFCTFYWRGVDAFKTFGAFIVNKNDLKFYNGPSFSNDYVQPQYETAAGLLTGVKFKTQQISFEIGVYWISIEHYRQLIYWLHPYEINSLAFGFDKEHYYQVKLASRNDSIRTIIGYETVDGVTEPRYFTTLKLTFEVQGAPCAYNNEEFRLIPNIDELVNNNTQLKFQLRQEPLDQDAQISSDLPAPIQANFRLELGLKKENFLNRYNEYNLQNTAWNLVDEIDFAVLTETLNLSYRIGFTTGTGHYDGIIINPVLNQIKFYQNSAEFTVYQTGYWFDSRDASIQFDDALHYEPFINIFSDDKLINFLIQNNKITYYNDMKLNVSLLVGMNGNVETESIPIDPKTLFDVTLKNLTWGSSAEEAAYAFDLGYDSESGLLYLTSGDSEYFLLNTLSTSAKGQRIVDAMTVNTFAITGLFEDPWFDINNLYFILKLSIYSPEGTIMDTLTLIDNTTIGTKVELDHFSSLDCDKSYISLRGRTNLI